MKTLCLILTACVVLLLPACKQDGEINTKQAIGVLHGGMKKLIILEGKQEKVLELNGARRKEGATYEVPAVDAEGRELSLAVNLTLVANLEGYLDMVMAEPSFYAELYYEDARCSEPHPGFLSDCEPTFDEHAQSGRAMIWRVEPWSSCVNGNSTCTEKWRSVGTIDYYDMVDCSDTDTLSVKRPIMRYRCDGN